ncbi:MAG: Rpn family recombination-promoting nuclease/putative transposase [Muribaculaceae bacterium]|nr:Rpn family recombination-promoting nuclease/putative transposase [Muribaculaceae bacterium]
MSEPLLIKLLNSIFAGDPILGNIVSLRFTNTEHPNEYIEGRGIRYDIECITSTGHHFIVEMQKGEQRHLIERSEYYVARAVAAQGYKGKDDENKNWDFSLMPVVGVFICNFKVAGLGDSAVTYGGMCDLKTGKPIGKSQCFVYIQLPCFNKKLFKLIFYSHLREIFELISSLEEVATSRLVPMRGAEAAKKIRKGE